MAETGRPLLELFPPGGTIPCDSAFPNVPVLPVSKSSAELAKVPLQPEELQESSDKVPRSENVLEDSSHIKANTTMHVTGCVVDRLAVRSVAHPHSVADVHAPDGAGVLRGDCLTHETEQGFGSHTSFLNRDRGEQIADPAKPPARSSPSDRGPVSAPQCETGGTARPGTGPEASVQSLACDQTMQLQQSSSAFCPPGIICPAQHGCPRSARTGPQAAGELSGYPKHSSLEEAICCGSYPHVVIEDTFAAYCHPQPIPAPAQLLLQKAPPEGCKGQGCGPPLLALPPLVSSVSETGLDGKHLLHCCKLDCNWPGPQQRVGTKTGATRDVATMTPRTELRDAGVQVGQEQPEKQARHVFPEVCLVDEGPAARKKSPVREVKWDAEGMTWEVYGASVDPEELGLAIQKHLELQIKETAGKAAKLSRQSTITSHTSAGKGRRRRRSLMTALRPPGCCTRTTTAAD